MSTLQISEQTTASKPVFVCKIGGVTRYTLQALHYTVKLWQKNSSPFYLTL